MKQKKDKTKRNTQPVSDLPGRDASPPVVTVDYDLYAHYLEDSDLSEKEKREFLQMLWNIICEFVSLGFGVHFCLGASLARLEGRIALEETLLRFPEWEVLWDQTERVHTSTVRGYAKVPLRL